MSMRWRWRVFSVWSLSCVAGRLRRFSKRSLRVFAARSGFVRGGLFIWFWRAPFR
jgi:hypothetical protein